MNQKTSAPLSGYVMLVLVLVLLLAGTLGLIMGRNPLFIWPLVLAFILMPGFFFINPNSSIVLVLFGGYQGTVKKNGFYWVNPFLLKNQSPCVRVTSIVRRSK